MDDFFLNLLLNVFLTAIAYTAFPLIRICINHGRFSKKRAKRIALWNSVIVGFIFCIFTIVLSESGTTWNAAPAFLYYWINRAILTDKYLSDDEEMNKQPEPEEQPVTPICPQHNSEQNIHSSNYVNCNVNDEDIRTVVSKSTIQHTSTQYESVSKVKPSIAFCRKCGNKLTEHAIFCHKCGCPIYTPVYESDNSACADDITPSMVTQDKVFSVQPVQKIKSKKNKKSAIDKYFSKNSLENCLDKIKNRIVNSNKSINIETKKKIIKKITLVFGLLIVFGLVSYFFLYPLVAFYHGNYSVFVNMYDIKEFNVPDSVTELNNDAFYGCSSLINVSIPHGVNNIDDNAFYGCSGITEISIPESVTNIGDNAFYGCSGITEISIPESVVSIGDNAFRDCNSLTNVILPKKFIKRFDERSPFDWDNIITLTIQDSVSSIDAFEFKNCTNLKNVILPKSVIKIGKGAFYNCINLNSITISEGVTTIGDEAFFDCANLTNIVLPNSVKTIGESAFFDCDKLTTIVLPNSLEKIGDRAFFDCDKLTTISIPNSVKKIGYFVFNSCDNLNDLTINNGVRYIEDMAFSDCKKLTYISIPNTIRRIGQSMFMGCNLKRVYIPESVSAIEYGAFGFNYNLSSVHYEGTKKQWYSIQINNDAFCGIYKPITVYCDDGKIQY